MHSRRRPQSSATLRASRRLAVAGVLTALVAGCVEPPPRSFLYFMDDKIARDGVLARCDLEPDASANDIECANARRAAATVALREERERRKALELESERKLEALRTEIERRERAEREAVAAAARAAREAYEAQWENGVPGTVPAPSADRGAGGSTVAPDAAPDGPAETGLDASAAEAPAPDAAPAAREPAVTPSPERTGAQTPDTASGPPNSSTNTNPTKSESALPQPPQ